MQENIENIIRDMTEQGYSSKEISCFINGINQGISIFKFYILESKMEITPNETDPVYAHTWNNIIDALSLLTDKIKESIFKKE